MRRATADVLPECLIQKILCFLSYEEATKMSILSKTWLQASMTLPNLKFEVDYSKGNMKIVVDNIMERYRDGKISIEKFELSDLSVYSQAFALIDKWLDIALQNGVKDLVFTVHNFPLSIFTILAAKTLRDLVLECCTLMPVSLSSGVVNCNSLRKLSLSYVTLDENMLQTLLNSCPLIVSFILVYCSGLENIELLNLQKIKSVSIQARTAQHLKIQAPTLEHLSYFDFPEGLDIVECQNLKSLELTNVNRSDGFLQHLISRSQLLESLILSNVSDRWERFNICKNQSLKILKLRSCDGIKEIDASNLISLEYEGYQIPELKLGRESSQLKHSKIDLRCNNNNVNAAWFSKLGKFLSNSTSWSQVSLYFPSCSVINMNDLQLYHRGSTPQVGVLNVYFTRQNEQCPTFMDALLWTCHPKRLNLQSTREIFTCFMDRLMYLKNSSQSTSHGSKPWYSQLKEVKAYKFDRKNESWHPVEYKSGELATRKPNERDKYYILLNW